MKIADSNGVWLQNTGMYRLPDPESGTIFEPGEPTKATETEWAKGQPTLVTVDDPTPAAPVVKTLKASK